MTNPFDRIETSMRTKHLASVVAIVLLSLSGLPSAQVLNNTKPVDEFKEIDVGPAPSYSLMGLLPLEMIAPSTSALKYGLDPSALTIGSDGVVRYVVVAYSPGGSVNAFFEGLRCATGEVKTYARSTRLGQWSPATQAKWVLIDGSLPTRFAMHLSQRGVCDITRVAVKTVPQLIELLRNPVMYNKL
jgi:hypothetical protein